jgi:hypothetical protein
MPEGSCLRENVCDNNEWGKAIAEGCLQQCICARPLRDNVCGNPSAANVSVKSFQAVASGFMTLPSHAVMKRFWP